MEVDLELPPDLWDELTDLSITVYDSTGQQVRGGNQPVNYAFGRMSMALSDSVIGVPLTIEFYPAFARLPGHSWRATARARFLGPDDPVGVGVVLSVVAGGRTVLRLPNPPALAMPDGFAALIETRVTTLTGSLAGRRAQGHCQCGRRESPRLRHGGRRRRAEARAEPQTDDRRRHRRRSAGTPQRLDRSRARSHEPRHAPPPA